MWIRLYLMMGSIKRVAVCAIFASQVAFEACASDLGELTYIVDGSVQSVSRIDDRQFRVPKLQSAFDDFLQSKTSAKRLVIRVVAGVYSAESVSINLSAVSPKPVIEILADGRVVMEGRPHMTWMRVNSSDGENTNITVRGFVVSGYKTAISFDGNRENVNGWNGGNVIEGNLFIRIGGRGAEVSTAVLRFVNSRENLITNNLFASVSNEVNCGLIHPVYFAHYSSYNKVIGNNFIDACSDAIRIRDSSNGNHIEGNVFSSIKGVGVVSMWHCNPGEKYVCTKSIGYECLSVGTVVKSNKFDKGAREIAPLITWDVCDRREGT